MHIPKEVIAIFTEDGLALLYNVFSRTSLVLSPQALAQALALGAGESAGQGPFSVWDAMWFSNECGLLEDPTRVLRNRADWPTALSLTGEELQHLLCTRCLLVDSLETYTARFAPKLNLLDFFHFGNFHQQLGQHLITALRVDPAKWWYDQKFLPDFTGMRDNLYKFIQEAFLKKLFADTITPGMRILDVGAGVGYISRMMAACGAEVIGVDPNAHYVHLAEECRTPFTRFVRADIGQEPMHMIEDNWADVVYMSDALLFYFIPERPDQRTDVSLLLYDIGRILKPGGRFWSLEPHAAFFLAPRFGEESRPFTVLTEYRHKQFGITPCLSDTLRAVLKHGFCLTNVQELSPDPEGMANDLRAFYFAENFPQWQFLEFTKLS